MELRHLRYVVAVAEELHFGNAARRLHVSQPPLSQQIKALELELGVRLFERTRRHVELTDAGRAFVAEARATLEHAARTERAAKQAGQGVSGSLVIGFVTSASYSILPPAVRRFRARWPGIEVSLREMIPSAQLVAIERREIDVGLLRPPVDHPGVDVETVLDEPLVAALPAGHALAERKSLALRDLAQEPWVLFPRRHGPGLIEVILDACRAAGFTPSVAHEPNEMQAVLAFVASGLGVSLVPASLSSFHGSDIVYRRLRGLRDCVALAIASAAGRDSAVVRNFAATCREQAKDLRATRPATPATRRPGSRQPA